MTVDTSIRSSAKPTYRKTTFLFTRGLALIYFAAFLSLLPQISGLIGEHGISPAGIYLSQVFEAVGAKGFWRVPTLAWIRPDAFFLQGLCGAGVFFSLLLFIGFFPRLMLVALWILYLSLVHVGQEFLSFQWDILLLEAGFLACWTAPWVAWDKAPGDSEPSFWVRALFRWLWFRLIFSSGAVKLLSGDLVWRNLRALTFHYETTPIPVWTGWYLHHLPFWFHQISTILMFVIELGLPLLIGTHRRGRLICFWGQIFFQILLILTGNYAFFNYLTIVLSLWLLDDTWIEKFCRPQMRVMEQESRRLQPDRREWAIQVRRALRGLVLGSLSLFSVVTFSDSLKLRVPWPGPLRQAIRLFSPFYLVNHYGLFAVMTTRRAEVILEGSRDGEHWLEYEFYWKPGALDHKPAFVAPHQPRLDWEMWFAALGSVKQNLWVVNLMRQLLWNQQPVLALLKKNPFAQEPPQYIRAMLYDYHFTDEATLKRSGQWWRRTLLASYTPILVRRGQMTYWTQ